MLIRSWQKVAAARGMALGPFDPSGFRSIRGTQRDLPVSVRVLRDDLTAEPDTLVVVELPREVDLEVRAGRGSGTRNPVVDLLLDVRGAEQTRFEDDEAGASLLAVFHRYPRSTLVGNVLTLRAEVLLYGEALHQALDAALDLGSLLKDEPWS